MPQFKSRRLGSCFSVGRDLDRQLLPSAVPAETKHFIDTLIPNDKRRREALHQYISHLTSMQAEAVRAASEWQETRLSSAVWWTGSLRPFVLSSKVTGSCTAISVTDGRPSCHLCGLVLIRCLIRLAIACIGCSPDPADLKEHLCHIDELYEYRIR